MVDGYNQKQNMMRTRFIILAALLVFILPACSNEKPQTINIIGEWELMDIQATKSAQIGNETIEIYLEFKDDKTFNLWQKLGAGRHKKFTGTWELTESVLTGKYSDGRTWGSSYNVRVESDNLYMSETYQNLETYIYKSSKVPAGL